MTIIPNLWICAFESLHDVLVHSTFPDLDKANNDDESQS